MGIYDILEYVCPSCGEIAHSQTKIGICEMELLKIGSPFPIGFNAAIVMKSSCEHCGEQAAVIVRDNKIIGFGSKDIGVLEESMYGSLFALGSGDVG